MSPIIGSELAAAAPSFDDDEGGCPNCGKKNCRCNLGAPSPYDEDPPEGESLTTLRAIADLLGPSVDVAPDRPDRDDVAAVRAALVDIRTIIDRGIGYLPAPSRRRPGATRRRLALINELLEHLEAREDLVDLQKQTRQPGAGESRGAA